MNILKPEIEVDGKEFSFSKQLILGESCSFSRVKSAIFTAYRSLVALQLLRQDPRGRKVARSAAEKIQVEGRPGGSRNFHLSTGRPSYNFQGEGHHNNSNFQGNLHNKPYNFTIRRFYFQSTSNLLITI